MAILPLDSFLCWKLKVAIIVIVFYTIVAASFAAILEVLDIAALADDNFEIQGGFHSHWRAHVWEGWLACNIVMIVANLIIIAYSVVMYFAVKRFPTFYELHLTKGYMALYIIYIIVELGISCYKYSWYAGNTFRLPYLAFSFLFWLIRALVNITAVVVIHSRICEIQYEIKYGERKSLDPFADTVNLLRSGATTPGRMTPRTY